MSDKETATDQSIKAHDKLRSQRMFEYAMESFQKRWAPRHINDSAQFQTELFSLVRMIYADAQAPLLDHITKIATAYSAASPIFIESTGGD